MSTVSDDSIELEAHYVVYIGRSDAVLKTGIMKAIMPEFVLTEDSVKEAFSSACQEVICSLPKAQVPYVAITKLTVTRRGLCAGGPIVVVGRRNKENNDGKTGN